MDPIQQITIAAPTYGSLPRVNFFIQSAWNNLEPDPKVAVNILVVDDGTPDRNAVEVRKKYCEKFNVHFVDIGKNLGIPGAWNVIFHWAQDHGSNLVFCCNDDIRLLAPGWLSRLLYVFNHNDKIGGVGVPTVDEHGFKLDDPRWNTAPARVGAAIGCSFAMRPDVLFQVKNPDGSMGFWEGLKSFHEETTCGFRLWELGYYSLMLAWPPVHHIGGTTFRTNPELVWMDFPEGYDLKEFCSYAQALPWYIPDFQNDYNEGKVDRMTLSRFLFTKYWGLFDGPRVREIPNQGEVDCWANPQIAVHEKIVTPMPQKEIHWLDRTGQPKVSVI